ncbi:MAG: hypothetical protein QNJ20_04870 [Paracoccaceae bacterium]|nr:hypothetical protein [Paracoccaceae bacterium]
MKEALLSDLLATHEVCHPSRPVSLFSEGAEATLTIEGFPWWDAELPRDADAQLVLSFASVVEGNLQLPLDDAEFRQDGLLDGLALTPLEDASWAVGPHIEVFCYRPFSDAMSIYLAVERALNDVECPLSPERYLNLGAWLQASSCFKLGTFPKHVFDRLEPQLQDHSILEADHHLFTGSQIASKVSVKFDENWLICDPPTARWECP